MASKPARKPVARLHVTASALRSADNVQVVKIYELVSRDIRRRVALYIAGPNVAEVVLDGIHLVGVVEKIKTDLSAGGREIGETWESCLFHAPRILQEKLARSTLAYTYEDVVDDDADDDGEDDDAR